MTIAKSAGTNSGERTYPIYLALGRLPVFIEHLEVQRQALADAKSLGRALGSFLTSVGLRGDEPGVPWVSPSGEEARTCTDWVVSAVPGLDADSRARVRRISLRLFKSRWPGFVSQAGGWELQGSETQDRFARRISDGMAETFHHSETVINMRGEPVRVAVLIASKPVLDMVESLAVNGEDLFHARSWAVVEELSLPNQLTVLRTAS